MKLSKTQRELLVEIYHGDTTTVQPKHTNVVKLQKLGLIKVEDGAVKITDKGNARALALL